MNHATALPLLDLEELMPSTEEHVFSKWNADSSVRSRPNSYDLSQFSVDEIKTKSWFAPNALSYLNHPAVKKLGEPAAQYMTASFLVFFLEYTALLEHRIVNRSVEYVAHDHMGIQLSPLIRNNALMLYADEAYHALMSAQVSQQVAQLFRIKIGPRHNKRVARLEAIAAAAPESRKPIVWFLIGFVSETVITKSFLKIAQNTVVKPVYNMLRDHLEDEWVHSRYFSDLFSIVWKATPANEKEWMGEMLAKIIFEFFKIDGEWLQTNLIHIGVSKDTATEIVSGRTSEEATRVRAKDGYSSTLHALKKAGFFDAPNMSALFARERLV